MSRRARALPFATPDDTSVSRNHTMLSSAERWHALFGCDAPNAAALVRQAIAWKEQVLAHGDVPPAIARDLAVAARQAAEARGRAASATSPAPAIRDVEAQCLAAEPIFPQAEAERLKRAAPHTPARTRAKAAPAPLPPASSQLQPGTRLVKAHGGRNHVVEVTEAGFVYEGAVFASLSAIAKHITGTHWNGLLFFGLRRRKTYPARAASGG